MSLKNKPPAQTVTWRRLILVYSGLFFIWLFYRSLFHTSVWIEETLIKGSLFLLPLFMLPVKGKLKAQALGITANNFFQSVYLGVTLGLILGLVGQFGNLIRHQTFIFSNFNLTSANVGAFLILSLITAFWEQLLFSGYFVTQINHVMKNELLLVSIVGLLFSLIHLPALVFVSHATTAQLSLSLVLLFTLGVGCAILRLRQNNLIAPIMAHALWGVTIFLFR